MQEEVIQGRIKDGICVLKDRGAWEAIKLCFGASRSKAKNTTYRRGLLGAVDGVLPIGVSSAWLVLRLPTPRSARPKDDIGGGLRAWGDVVYAEVE
jgi:hypothetical protein